MDCEKKIIENLYKQLNLYKLRSKVEILNLSNEFVVANLTKEKFLELENSKDEMGFTIKFREDPILLDPRSDKLGARLVINLEKLYLSIKKLGLKVSDVNEYYNYSHELGIAQIDTNNLQDKIFGIECNFEELNGIDFKKGCYVGQENTARIKLKDKLNKRLFAIKVLDGKINSDEITSENKNLGKLLINNKNPFALLKLEDKSFNFDKELKCGDLAIEFRDYDNSACDAIKMGLEVYDKVLFCNGGDRGNNNTPELDAFGNDDRVEFKWGVGGTDKKNSSSWILKKWNML